jgi:N-acetylmuramoyl-L-alanine amidase
LSRRPTHMCVYLMAAVAAVVALCTAATAGESISAIRYWTAPDHTRVVVDLTGEASYSTRVLTDPHRIVVLVVDGSTAGCPRETAVGDGLVDRVRLNQLSSGVQVVLDLTKASAHNVFTLKPYLNKPHRVVIDVSRNGEPSAPVPAATAPADGRPRVVILDPGHGGEDPGTLGNGKLKEKDVVLDIARKVGELLTARPGYSVHLTRDGDYFVRLAKRKEMANRLEGDLFISIHANSAPNRRAHGTEIFYVSPKGASDQAARELADRENAADLVGGVSPDADDDVLSILVDLKMVDSVQKSRDLAVMMDNELARRDVSSCVVKQAGFVVLKSLAMPSVLVEVGFLTNNSDVDRLKQSSFRQRYAECIAEAVDEYFDRYAPAVASNGKHKVAPGETLWSIARRYDLSVEELRELNGLGAGARILVDQVLDVGKS